LFIPLSVRADEREECQLALVEDTGGSVELINPTGDKITVTNGAAVQPGDLVRTAAGLGRICVSATARASAWGKALASLNQGADNVRESFVAWAFELVKGSLRAPWWAMVKARR